MGALLKGEASGKFLLCGEGSRALHGQMKLLFSVQLLPSEPFVFSQGRLFLSPKFKPLFWKLHLTFKKQAGVSVRDLGGWGRRGGGKYHSVSPETPSEVPDKAFH